MRSLLALMVGVVTMAACAAPTVGNLPSGDDVNLPARDHSTDTSGDDDDSTATTDKKGSTSSADTAPKKQTLSIASTGDGTGDITSEPSGVSCTGATCTGSFDSGTAVTLTAAPKTGSIFAGWSGGCTGTGLTCKTTVANATNVTAQFITLAGTWSGTYDHTESANGCTFNNQGNLTNTVAGDSTFTTAADMTGLQLKNGNCQLVSTQNGSASASALTVNGNTVTGTWTVSIPGANGKLPLPFTATITGTKMSGKWTCTGCTGSFDISKQAQ
jgi:hypothetical protein